MSQWNVRFWTPGHRPKEDGRTYGCACQAIASPQKKCDVLSSSVLTWPIPVEGQVISGTFSQVLAPLPRQADAPRAAVVLFSRADGMEEFLIQWNGIFPWVPVVGGSAARIAGQACGELRPGSSDVTVLLIRAGHWRAETLNVHDVTPTAVQFRCSSARTITSLREVPSGPWQAAGPFLRSAQVAHGRMANDCESITFADTTGRNIHVSFDGEVLHSGADLPSDGLLVLRVVSRELAARRLSEFVGVPNALVFGCAGIYGLLDQPVAVAANTLVGFIFGELVTVSGKPCFGNLMAARLVQVKGD